MRPDVMSEDASARVKGMAPEAAGRRPVSRRRREYGRAVVIVAVTTVIATTVRELLHVPDVEMLFLLGVMLVAATSERGPSIAASILSVAAYDFFIVPPPFTLDVEDARYVLTFVMMLGVGVVISTLSLRVREQERAAAQLAEETRRAALRAQTEELRSSLLSSVSHDLRTPLAAITGAATTLRADPELPAETRRELVETVCDEAERLERLLGNLLDMTRLEAGAVEPKRDWVPLVEIVGAALTRLDLQLAGRALTAEIPEDLPLLLADPVLLEQLLTNVLENAARHTPPGSPIELSARVDGERVVVEVADRGPGIPPGAEETIFERFRKGRHSAGVGLGLAIARAIAVAHGGTLVAASREGGGAVFRFELPGGDSPPASERAEGA
ncbi:MAG TPA: DUF4118 domain-containing protein [Anaeromyxobacteraceae bacterium]|nr:DUF4118 domain-containing protein [Anaeromyxobacteraceae bacterium]